MADVGYKTESIRAIYDNYSDDNLRHEFNIYESIYDVPNLEDTLLIEYLDNIRIELLESIANRFVHSSFVVAPSFKCEKDNVIYLNCDSKGV